MIEARAPAGSFTVDALQTRPAVLMAAGIGVTPMIAMLRHILYEGMRKRRLRETWFFYSARSKEERAFDKEIAAIVEAGQGTIRLIRVLSQPGEAVGGPGVRGATVGLEQLGGPGIPGQDGGDGLHDARLRFAALHGELHLRLWWWWQAVAEEAAEPHQEAERQTAKLAVSPGLGVSIALEPSQGNDRDDRDHRHDEEHRDHHKK